MSGYFGKVASIPQGLDLRGWRFISDGISSSHNKIVGFDDGFGKI